MFVRHGCKHWSSVNSHKESDMLKRGGMWIVAVVAALLATSSVCHAQDVVLYEISEAVKVNGKTGSFNSSEATLMGWARAGTPVCPSELNLQRCSVTVPRRRAVVLSLRPPPRADNTETHQRSVPAEAPPPIRGRWNNRGVWPSHMA